MVRYQGCMDRSESGLILQDCIQWCNFWLYPVLWPHDWNSAVWTVVCQCWIYRAWYRVWKIVRFQGCKFSEKMGNFDDRNKYKHNCVNVEKNSDLVTVLYSHHCVQSCTHSTGTGRNFRPCHMTVSTALYTAMWSQHWPQTCTSAPVTTMGRLCWHRPVPQGCIRVCTGPVTGVKFLLLYMYSPSW